MRQSWCLGLGLLGAALGAQSAEPFASTYRPLPSQPVLIRDATVLIGDGTRIDGGDVLLRDGKVAEVAADIEVAADVTVIDAKGRWVSPGIIDVHSHLGVYPHPGVTGHQDGNEMSAPVTPNVWAEHGVNPQDPGFEAALAGGVTAMLVLPGSANLIGGRGVTLKNVPADTYQAMKFPGAPHALKIACGENPKRVYGGKGQAPSTRMGNVAGYRQAFADAEAYRREWDKYTAAQAAYDKPGRSKSQRKKGEPPQVPKRDLKLDTLIGVLKGDILVHNHCYRSDEMATMIDVSKEFGFKISAFHHAVEAYKIADLLAENRICGALWADWWGFKMEAFDGIQENIAIVDRVANGCAIVHSDSSEGIQRLNQEAGKAMARGNRMGYAITPERAMRWLTQNPAQAMGIADRTGTLQAGKMADVVIWDRDPFSVYAHADQVFIDGALVLDRSHPRQKPNSDFMLGAETEVAP
jgi:imidazolonepropionase-like amidohydrolase